MNIWTKNESEARQLARRYIDLETRRQAGAAFSLVEHYEHGQAAHKLAQYFAVSLETTLRKETP